MKKRLFSCLMAFLLVLPMVLPMGACTTQEGGENVANMLYNGVELPDINTVWTDKETYPYAYITYAQGLYGLNLTSTPTLFRVVGSYFEDSHTEAFDYATFLTAVDATEWAAITSGSEDAGDHLNNTTDMVIIWANHDVYRWSDDSYAENDGSLYLAASDPVSTESKLKINVADSNDLFFYNGAELPAPPNYDAAKYPYAYLVRGTNSDGVEQYQFIVANNTAIHTNVDGVDYVSVSDSTESAYELVWYLLTDGAWGAGTVDSGGSNSIFAGTFGTTVVKLVWASVDVLTDGTTTVYFAGSNYVSLSGMALIRHDGSTTGLVTAPTSESYASYYKVSDATPQTTDFVGGAFAMVQQGALSGGEIPAEMVDGAVIGENAVNFSDMVIVAYADGATCSTGQFGSVTLPEAGVYFMNVMSGTMYVSLIAYPSADASGVTDTTATVNFTCKDLLYTDSVYRIKAWVYEPSGYSYGGVELPDINTVWTDKETYPYAAIAPGEVYMLVVSSAPLCYYPDISTVSNSADCALAIYGLMNGQWVLAESGSAPQGSLAGGSEITWTNTDILNEDGTLFFSASEPTPGGLDTTLPATYTGELFAGPTHSESHIFTGLTPATDYAVYGVIWLETDGAASEHNALATFTTLEGEATEAPDFSGAALEVAYTEVTTDSAYLEVNFAGIPQGDELYTYLDCTLDDGTEATDNPILIDNPPSDNVSGVTEVRFANLEPDTEYTATFKLVYQLYGETGYTDPGVEITTTFTTAKDGGFDRDSFLLGMASGLGCTAATKADAEYNSWMQGYIVGDELRKAITS